MLSNISNDSLIAGNSVNQNENIKSLGKNEEAKNAYSNPAEFNDSLEVSNEAKALLQRDKDIEFFKSLILDTPTCNNEELQAIMELIQEGEFIDNKELAEAMQADGDLLNYLFPGINLAS